MLFFDLFRHEANIVSLHAGKALFRENDPCNGLMYVLVAGRARVLVGDQVVENATTGAIFGEMAIIRPEPRSATVMAETDCKFAEINRKRFDFLVTEMPGFAVEVMKVMAGRLRRADQRLAQQASA
jgi:CRP/FNR family transcriptional regulator, cyclic AMP receptor protein